MWPHRTHLHARGLPAASVAIAWPWNDCVIASPGQAEGGGLIPSLLSCWSVEMQIGSIMMARVAAR